jgi:hypothetical protein
MLETVKRKKRKFKITYDNLELREIIIEESEIRKKIFVIMKEHIGVENKISAYELFVRIFSQYPMTLDSYIRYFWWDVVMKIIRQMRRDCDPLIVSRKEKFFYVLQSEKEFLNYNSELINEMKKAQERAKDWVSQKKWLSYLQGENNGR